MYRLIYEVCLIVWHLSLYVVSSQFIYTCFLMEVWKCEFQGIQVQTMRGEEGASP